MWEIFLELFQDPETGFLVCEKFLKNLIKKKRVENGGFCDWELAAGEGWSYGNQVQGARVCL